MYTPAVKRRIRLTLGGLLYTGVTIIIGMAAMNSRVNLFYLVFGISAGGLVLSLLLSRACVFDITVDRVMPAESICHRPFPVTYTVRNRRWWTGVASLLIDTVSSDGGEPRISDLYLPFVRSGANLTVRTQGLCVRRGRYRCGPIRLTTRFPFGLISRTVEFGVDREITVLPPLGRIRRDPWANPQEAGRGYSGQPGNRRGVSDEFYALREYRPGDNLRWVHWRRSARTGQLLVREMSQMRAARLIVILDVPRESATSSVTNRENVISFAATLISDALERGYQVGLVANSETPVVIPPGAGRGHLYRVMTELAMLKPHAGRSLQDIVGRIPWSGNWQGRCVVLGPVKDSAHETVGDRLLRHCDSVTVLHADSAAFQEIFDYEVRRPPAVQMA